jgi:gluconokinase
MQMLADALTRPVIGCIEPEATSRGAALLALERIGAIPDIHSVVASYDGLVEPKLENQSLYGEALERQRELYATLFKEEQ